MSAGLVTLDGEVLVTRRRPTHAAEGANAVEQLLSLVEEFCALPEAREQPIGGVGAGLPGVVDVDSGVVIGEAHHVPELVGVSIARLLADAAGAPAVVDNDVNALALGESRWGSGARRPLVRAPRHRHGSEQRHRTGRTAL
jgi:glucokinase